MRKQWMVWQRWLAAKSPVLGSLLCSALWLGGCTTTSTPPPQEAAPPAAVAAAPGVPGAPKAPAASVAVDTNCLVFSKLPGDPPVYVKGRNVVLTQFLKPCVSTSGQRGYERTTPWLAMGFPCTGGSGRIDIKGNYGNPKMVSFILGTDCGMSPNGREAVQKILREAFALPAESKLAAYTPFVVQFWEIPGMSDADTGFSIDLRSAPALEGTWRRVRENQPLRVTLFGREDNWAQGGKFYRVEADLKLSGRTSFQLNVVQVTSLTAEEKAGVQTRCQALRPARNCEAVF